MIKHPVARSWTAVLYLANLLDSIVIPSRATAMRKPVTATSLATMTATIQAGTLLRERSMIRVMLTRILSARGSKNFPKEVMMFCLRAM